MNRCGTCMHWAKNDAAWLKKQGSQISEEWRHFPCLRVKHDKDSRANPFELVCPEIEDDSCVAQARVAMAETDDVVVQDGSGYYAVLKTRASFGCVYHEEMERDAECD